MADCSKCKNCYFVGGFMECLKDLWSEIPNEPCEKFEERESGVTKQSIIKTHIEEMLENCTLDEVTEVLAQMKAAEGEG